MAKKKRVRFSKPRLEALSDKKLNNVVGRGSMPDASDLPIGDDCRFGGQAKSMCGNGSEANRECKHGGKSLIECGQGNKAGFICSHGQRVHK